MINESLITEDVEGEAIGQYDIVSHHLPEKTKESHVISEVKISCLSVDKKNQLDVTFCILYFSSNSCSTCFGQPCAHHQELTNE